MGGGNGGVEDRAQERASVGHGFTGFEGHAMPVIHPIPAKENPRSMLRGRTMHRVPDAVQRSSRCTAEQGPTHVKYGPRISSAPLRAAQHPGHKRQPPTSPSM